MYWAQSLAEQTEDKALQAKFIPIAQQLSDNESKIVTELSPTHVGHVDIGGYYLPNKELVEQVMRPSACFNAIISA
jgi:isocitrate dehydrogenase